MSISDPGSGHPSAAHNTDAIRFALHRLTQGQATGMIGPGAGGAPLQWSHDPNQLMQQFHRYNPLIAHQVHLGASLQQPSVHPLPAPGPQHTYAPQGVQPHGTYAPPASHTLPQHVAGGVPGAGVPANAMPQQDPGVLAQAGAQGVVRPPVDPNLLILNKLLGTPGA